VTSEEAGPSESGTRHGGYSHDSGWELPELAPVTIIVSVGLLVLGSGISTWMSLIGQTDLSGGLGWSLVTSALRWIDPATTTMLLLSAALLWWQYGYWTSDQRVGVSEAVVIDHVLRLRAIARWNLAAFLVTIVSVLLLIIASILQNTGSGAPLAIWANSVDTICEAVGTILLSLLGLVGLMRILVAARTSDSSELPDSAVSN
jgi:uncharacterized membrane protein